MSTDTEPPPSEPSRAVKYPTWRPWIGLLIAVLIIGGVLAGLLLSRGSTNQASSQQLVELRQACTQWKASGSAPATPSDWCTNMIGWMSDRMDDHPRMWVSPEAMQETCQEWGAANPAGVSEGYRIAWCDDMVSWMQQHASQWGSWNGWMMHGPMTG